MISIDQVYLAFFPGSHQQVRMRTWLIREQHWAAGPQIVVTLVELYLIRGREVVQKLETLPLGAQFQNAVSEVAAVCRGIECALQDCRRTGRSGYYR